MSFARDEALHVILGKHPELSISLQLQVLLTKWRRQWWCHLLLAWAKHLRNLLWQGGLDLMIFRGLFQPLQFCDSVISHE